MCYIYIFHPPLTFTKVLLDLCAYHHHFEGGNQNKLQVQTKKLNVETFTVALVFIQKSNYCEPLLKRKIMIIIYTRGLKDMYKKSLGLLPLVGKT